MDEQRLKKVLSNILDMDQAEIGEESSMKTISNWDSLKHIQIMMAIEEEFEVLLSADNMVVMTDYPAMVKILTSLGL